MAIFQIWLLWVSQPKNQQDESRMQLKRLLLYRAIVFNLIRLCNMMWVTFILFFIPEFCFSSFFFWKVTTFKTGFFPQFLNAHFIGAVIYGGFFMRCSYSNNFHESWSSSDMDTRSISESIPILVPIPIDTEIETDSDFIKYIPAVFS